MTHASPLRLGAWLLAATMLAGCSQTGQNAQPAGNGQAGQTGKNFNVAFVTNNASDFWTIARRGCEKADGEIADVSVEFKIPSEGTAAEQKRLLDDLVAKGIDGIAMSPVDPINEVQLINDLAKQTVVITQDSDAPTSDRLCYLGTDNRAAGRQAGDLLKETLPNGGKIMVFVGKIDAQNAQERYEGIKESIAGSGIEILDVRTDDTDQIRAKSNVADTLVKYPEVACLVGLWSYNGPAILNAVRDAGKLGQVKIVCFDEDDQTLAGVRSGDISGTIVQQPYEFGYRSVHLLSKILHGDRSEVPATKQIFVPTLMIKKDNVEEFIARLNQLRGRS